MSKLGIVTSWKASLYAVPNAVSELTDELLHGMVVEILDKGEGDFYRIRTHYYYEGYVAKKCLLEDEVFIREWLGSQKKIMSKSCGDIQLDSRVQAPCLTGIFRGGLVVPLGEADKEQWQQVLLADGRRGFTKASYLMDEPEDYRQIEEGILRQRLVAAASAYLGVQYRWGGKTPVGIDCSGLTAMAYMLNGILIYRDAKIKPGFPMRHIAPEKVKAGDLLFFPGHVAMYIGDGKYIHSTSRPGSDGVVVNSLNPESVIYREDLAGTIIYGGTIFI